MKIISGRTSSLILGYCRRQEISAEWAEMVEDENGMPLMLHPVEMIARVREKVEKGENVITMNEIPFCAAGQLVRCKANPTEVASQIMFVFVGEDGAWESGVGRDGDMILPWPDGPDSIFEAAFYLRFDRIQPSSPSAHRRDGKSNPSIHHQ